MATDIPPAHRHYACEDHASACWAGAGEPCGGMPRCGHWPPVTCPLRAASADWPRLRLVRCSCRAFPGPRSSAGWERLPSAGAVWLDRAWLRWTRCRGRHRLLAIRTLALLTIFRGEPNGEPTTTDMGLRQATSSHCGNRQAARQATPVTIGPQFESAS